MGEAWRVVGVTSHMKQEGKLLLLELPTAGEEGQVATSYPSTILGAFNVPFGDRGLLIDTRKSSATSRCML